MKTFLDYRVVIVSYHLMNNSNDRPSFVAQALEEIAYISKLDVVASNFDHINKCYIETENVTRLAVKGYYKNISLQRVFSYVDFAYQISNNELISKANLVYVCVPDYLSAFIILYMKKYKGYSVVIDIVDLWPEAFPFPKVLNNILKNIFILIVRPLRKFLFRKADVIFFQSKYFMQKYGDSSKNQCYLPMCHSINNINNKIEQVSISDSICILFLGSINSITDVDSLVVFVTLLSKYKQVTLRIIGSGSSLPFLKSRINLNDIVFEYKGVIFDEQILSDEMSSAHFGFNGYRPTTEVSVSYKAIDYLRNGLPIINRSKGDLTDIIDSYGCGYNYDSDNISDIVDNLVNLTKNEYLDMRRKSADVFNDHFKYTNFSETLKDVINGLQNIP